jgi:hypothetical protein
VREQATMSAPTSNNVLDKMSGGETWEKFALEVIQ